MKTEDGMVEVYQGELAPPSPSPSEVILHEIVIVNFSV
jgi:hypothetical protein